MSIDNKFLIKKVTQRESFIACFCRATRMPFLYCDPVTYADQVWIFADENGLKEFAGRFAGKKIALQGTVIRKPQFAGFFGSLLHIGVTEIVFTENGANVSIPIDQFVALKDMSGVPEALRPLENPQLMLTGLYMMQEITRQVPVEEKEDLNDLQEEFLVNLARSRFLIPIQVNAGSGSAAEKIQKKQFSFLTVTTKTQDRFCLLFSDTTEFEKFRLQQKKDIRVISMPFAGLKPALEKGMKGYLMNPAGCQIALQIPLLDQVIKLFPDAVKKGTEDAMKVARSIAGPQVRKNAGPVIPKAAGLSASAPDNLAVHNSGSGLKPLKEGVKQPLHAKVTKMPVPKKKK